MSWAYFNPTRSPSKAVLLCLAVSVSVIVGIVSNARSPVEPDLITVGPAPQTLDLGDVYAVTEEQRKIILVNSGDDEVEVFELTPSCQCAKVSPSSFTLAPGASQELTASFDLSRAPRLASGERDQEFALVLKLRCRTRSDAIGWTKPLRLSGHLKQLVVPNPGLLLWTASETGVTDDAWRAKRIRLRRDSETTEVTLTSDPKIVSISTSESPGGEIVATCRLNPDLTEGEYESRIEVHAVGSDHQRRHVVDIPVFANVRRDVIAIPESLEFFLSPEEDGSGTETILVQSQSLQHFSVRTVRNPPGVKVIAVGETSEKWVHEFEITYDGTASATESGQIEIVIETPDGRRQTVVIPVRFLNFNPISSP